MDYKCHLLPILYSAKLNKYYIGSAIDKDERLARHNHGTEKFTSLGMPWEVWIGSFVKDENEKVTKIKLSMNGSESELPRME